MRLALSRLLTLLGALILALPGAAAERQGRAPQTWPCGCDPRNGDLNHDGVLDFFDVDLLVDFVVGGSVAVPQAWYAWDAENRLLSVEPAAPLTSADKKVAFTYDFLGRRTSKRVWTWDAANEEWDLALHRKFVHDGWLLLLELDGLDDDAAVRRHTWGLDLAQSRQGAGGVGGLLGTQEGSNSYLYFHDAAGNVSELVHAANGTVAAHYEYDAYGNVTAQSGAYAAANPFRFSTKAWDDETGLGYWGRRYYSPKLGRWLNRDPITEAGGFNLYAFADNGPTNAIDSLGEEVIPQFLWTRDGKRMWRFRAYDCFGNLRGEEVIPFDPACNNLSAWLEAQKKLTEEKFCGGNFNRACNTLCGVGTGARDAAVGLADAIGHPCQTIEAIGDAYERNCDLFANSGCGPEAVFLHTLATGGAHAMLLNNAYNLCERKDQHGNVLDDYRLGQEAGEIGFGLVSAYLFGKGFDSALSCGKSPRIAGTAIAAGPESFADDLGRLTSTIRPKPGFTDVIIHADSGAFYVNHGGKLVPINHRVLANLLNTRGVQGNIRLISCAAGKGQLAQNLANKLGVQVEAATNKVWLYPGTTCGPYIELPGRWQTFCPVAKP